MTTVAAPLILSFDTATRYCSVALTRGGIGDGQVVATASLALEVTHSRRLLGLVEWLLDQAGVTLKDVEAIAFGLGPGSFTGLRIGMATAKGLCHGAGKPLLGVSSLDAIGCGIDSDELICAVLDARKKEVYSRFYRRRADGLIAPCSEPRVSSPSRLTDAISEPVVLAGEGVGAYQSVWRDHLGAGMRIAPARYHYPAAEMIGLLTAQHYRAGSFLDLDLAGPLYVRASDAELSLVSPIMKEAPETMAGGRAKG